MPNKDPRWHEVADVLVHCSTTVQSGERVMIVMGDSQSRPYGLARSVVESSRNRRARAAILGSATGGE